MFLDLLLRCVEGIRISMLTKKIIKADLKNKILKNKNVNFSEFMTLKLDLENTSINCFFGYQDDNRIVLCY